MADRNPDSSVSTVWLIARAIATVSCSSSARPCWKERAIVPAENQDAGQNTSKSKAIQPKPDGPAWLWCWDWLAHRTGTLYSNRWTIAMITVRNSLTAPTYARGVKCWQDEMVHLRGSKFVTSNQLWRRRRGTL